MFAHKKNYYLIIENTKDINLKNIKIRNKFSIIYRNHKNNENRYELFKFSKMCKLKAIKFYVANNFKLALHLNSSGVYLSASNYSLKYLTYKNSKFEIIGAAHNLREIRKKMIQGCNSILLSKLFFVNYDRKASYLGVIKFNNYQRIFNNLIPLGGIKLKNLNSLNIINGKGFALLSEVKKKPANIINRLF
jgi:thiamine-phosphate pyrophosphorylase